MDLDAYERVREGAWARLDQLARRRRLSGAEADELVRLYQAAVTAKFGVGPASIADYLALVGDSADGYPGLAGWGSKSAATVLAKFGSIVDIPASSGDWGLPALRGAEKLAVTLRDNLELALLFRRIATIEVDVPVGKVDDWHWKGPTPGFAAICDQLGAPHLVERAERIAKRTAPAD